MSVVLELRQSAEQTAFNLRRWEEVQAATSICPAFPLLIER